MRDCGVPLPVVRETAFTQLRIASSSSERGDGIRNEKVSRGSERARSATRISGAPHPCPRIPARAPARRATRSAMVIPRQLPAAVARRERASRRFGFPGTSPGKAPLGGTRDPFRGAMQEAWDRSPSGGKAGRSSTRSPTPRPNEDLGHRPRRVEICQEPPTAVTSRGARFTEDFFDQRLEPGEIFATPTISRSPGRVSGTTKGVAER